MKNFLKPQILTGCLVLAAILLNFGSCTISRAPADVLITKALVCKKCNKTISGRYIKVDGHVFHAKCFACSKCGKKIKGQYQKKGAKFYHPKCYIQAKGLSCAYCGKLLEKKYAVFEKKKYHPLCIKKQIAKNMPICKICGKRIEKKYAFDDKGKYHPTCYKEYKLPQCNVCSKPIEGKYIKDPWGKKAHEKHWGRPTTLCSSCNRIIFKSLSKGRHTYPDGRIICGFCRSTAIENSDDVLQSRKRVTRHLHSVGISHIPSHIPIRLVSKTSMKKKRNSANPKGYTQCKLKYRDGKLISRDQTVFILTGLPKLEFEGVLAHEFLHVWLNKNNISMSDSNTEGFCNLGAMVVYEADNSKFSKILLENMDKDPDPEYGKGYRRLKKKLKKLGWPRLIKNVKKGKP